MQSRALLAGDFESLCEAVQGATRSAPAQPQPREFIVGPCTLEVANIENAADGFYRCGNAHVELNVSPGLVRCTVIEGDEQYRIQVRRLDETMNAEIETGVVCFWDGFRAGYRSLRIERLQH